jgi:MFS transporter, DHA1 family, multidrug resistance protein
MADLIRDAPIGQLLRWATGNKILLYPEERPGFVLPPQYSSSGIREKYLQDSSDQPTPAIEPEGPPVEEVVLPDPETILESEDKDKVQDASRESHESSELEQIKTQRSILTVRSQLSRVGTKSALQKSRTRAELEEQFTLASIEKGPSRPIEPERLEDGTVLVDWYTTDDAENPQNWSFGKKAGASTLI